MDTEGKDLPEDVSSFFARGAIDKEKLHSFALLLMKKHIECFEIDAGDQKAGSIMIVRRATSDKEVTQYKMHINRNHIPAVQFATLAHELAHLFLGHLGPDKKLNIPHRLIVDHSLQELEAESVAYIVCKRNDVTSKSETYLTNYVNENTTVDDIDIYQVMRAAGQIETVLGLTAYTKYDKPKLEKSRSGVRS